MKRSTFLTIASLIALLVGSFVILCTDFFLEQVKGVPAHGGTKVWAVQTGVLLLGIGLTAFFIRKHEDSKTLKVVLLGNVLMQIGLATSELVGYSSGVLSQFSGILPNMVIHVLLSIGFLLYALKIEVNGLPKEN